MAEFFDAKEKIVDVGEPVVFENKTDSNFDVDTGIVFHKSGIYEVSILGNRTIVSKVTEKKPGKWIVGNYDRVIGYWATCSLCGRTSFGGGKYCSECGAKMERGSNNETG